MQTKAPTATRIEHAAGGKKCARPALADASQLSAAPTLYASGKDNALSTIAPPRAYAKRGEFVVILSGDWHISSLMHQVYSIAPITMMFKILYRAVLFFSVLALPGEVLDPSVAEAEEVEEGLTMTKRRVTASKKKTAREVNHFEMTATNKQEKESSGHREVGLLDGGRKCARPAQTRHN